MNPKLIPEWLKDNYAVRKLLQLTPDLDLSGQKRDILLINDLYLEGTIINGQLNGFGRIRSEGLEMEGQFIENELNGYGRMKTANSISEGIFEKGQLNGSGTMIRKEFTANGEFENDQLIEGNLTDGTYTYTGTFVDFQLVKGYCSGPEGTIVGSFVDQKAQGFCSYTYHGVTIHGHFEKGHLVEKDDD